MRDVPRRTSLWFVRVCFLFSFFFYLLNKHNTQNKTTGMVVDSRQRQEKQPKDEPQDQWASSQATTVSSSPEQLRTRRWRWEFSIILFFIAVNCRSALVDLVTTTRRSATRDLLSSTLRVAKGQIHDNGNKNNHEYNWTKRKETTNQRREGVSASNAAGTRTAAAVARKKQFVLQPRAFSPWNATERGGPLPCFEWREPKSRMSPLDRGFLFVKPMKVGGSTAAG